MSAEPLIILWYILHALRVSETGHNFGAFGEGYMGKPAKSSRGGTTAGGTQVIVSDPGVMMGKPVIRGTRITVELVLEKLGAGESIEDLLAAYPHLKREYIQAALAFAAEAMKADVVYPLAGDP